MAWDFLTRVRAKLAPQPGTLHAIDPAAHMSTGAPESMRGLDATGSELDGVAEHPDYLAPAVRSWRSTAGRFVDVSGDVALSDDRGTAANEHMHAGKPDARRTQDAPAGAPTAPAVAPIAGETRTNSRGAVALSPAAPPERTRGGFTGADPTRAATMQVAHTVRPFDKGMAEHGNPIRPGQPGPTASRPPQRGRLAGARPSAGGTGDGTGMLPVGLHPGTTRQQPGPWGAGLTETDSGTVTSARTRGWRL